MQCKTSILWPRQIGRGTFRGNGEGSYVVAPTESPCQIRGSAIRHMRNQRTQLKYTRCPELTISRLLFASSMAGGYFYERGIDGREGIDMREENADLGDCINVCERDGSGELSR